MKKVKIVRLEESDSGTFGVMLISGRIFCVTLEPPDKNNQRNISNIPPGTYICEKTISARFGETFEVKNVPGRTHILFHSGNFVDHTHGCILLGSRRGKLGVKRAILNSGQTFRLFLRNFLLDDAFELEIVEID